MLFTLLGTNSSVLFTTSLNGRARIVVNSLLINGTTVSFDRRVRRGKCMHRSKNSGGGGGGVDPQYLLTGHRHRKIYFIFLSTGAQLNENKICVGREVGVVYLLFVHYTTIHEWK